MPRLFLSHSHKDKPVVRRLLRDFACHGIEVWLDERQLRPDAGLTTSVMAEVEAAEVLMFVASEAGAASAWVGREMDHALALGRNVVRAFVDPLDTHPRFSDLLGVDLTRTQEQAVEDRVGHNCIAEDLAPLADSAVRGDEHGAALVATAHKLEEQMRGVWHERKIWWAHCQTPRIGTDD